MRHNYWLPAVLALVACTSSTGPAAKLEVMTAQAVVGDTVVQTQLIKVADSTHSWVSRVKHNSAWLTLRNSYGGTDGWDTVFVQFNPTGLTVGTYIDTISVSLQTVHLVPVELNVLPH